MKRSLPLLITFLAGLAVIVQFYSPRLEFLGDLFERWFNIVVVFSFTLGFASIAVVNGRKVASKAPGWGYNAVLLAGLLITLFLGLWQGNDEGTPCYYVFWNVLYPLQSTMFSLLAFFIVSAAFRAFKARTLEAALLIIAAFIVVVGRVPLGEVLWRQIPYLGSISLNDFVIDKVIMGCFNNAGQRAILLGASLGVISVSLKILLGIERSYLGED